jgi:plasmid maintenance system killer protein
MKITYSSEKLATQFNSKQEILKKFGPRTKKVVERIDVIETAENLMEIEKIEVLQCRQLSNNPSAQWIMKIVANYSMIFVLDHSPIPLSEDGSINKLLVTDIRIIGFIP